MAGHPHAALMLQYAQESLTDAKAWKNWDLQYGSQEWVPLTDIPTWREGYVYRRRPERSFWEDVEVDAKILVNGVPRYFAGYEKETKRVKFFSFGATSFSHGPCVQRTDSDNVVLFKE